MNAIVVVVDADITLCLCVFFSVAVWIWLMMTTTTMMLIMMLIIIIHNRSRIRCNRIRNNWIPTHTHTEPLTCCFVWLTCWMPSIVRNTDTIILAGVRTSTIGVGGWHQHMRFFLMYRSPPVQFIFHAIRLLLVGNDDIIGHKNCAFGSFELKTCWVIILLRW